jgi:hypothetical protein
MPTTRLAALALFLALALAPPLAAQDPQEGDRPPGPVASGHKTLTLPHSFCPESVALVITATYPKDTGNAQVDEFFEHGADDFIGETSAYARGYLLQNDHPCDYPGYLEADLSYAASKPNPEVLGVLVSAYELLGGPHYDYDFEAFNFDLVTGRELALHDLFPNTEAGIAKIYAFAYAELCHKTPDHEAARTVLGGTCGEDKTAPAALLTISGRLDKLAHLALTEKGALLSFHPDDIWSWELGHFELPISKEDLLAMGARDFWGDKSPLR